MGNGCLVLLVMTKIQCSGGMTQRPLKTLTSERRIKSSNEAQ